MDPFLDGIFNVIVDNILRPVVHLSNELTNDCPIKADDSRTAGLKTEILFIPPLKQTKFDNSKAPSLRL
jgi:hypothetical protein